MLYRKKPPNAARWNGLGGRIEAGETPLESIKREMMEEAAIDLDLAQELRFAGLVTWAPGVDPTRPSGGMYTFLARLPPDFPLWPDRSMNEGLLSWKALAWVCDSANQTVVSNIPHFLPLMLEETQPREYRCAYKESVLQAMTVHEMPFDLGMF
jgi:8-oxo-dGTP diphosphatase